MGTSKNTVRFFVIILVLVVVVLGVLLRSKLFIRGNDIDKIKTVFQTRRFGGYIVPVNLYPNTYIVRGIMLGFDEVEENVGNYWYFGKVHLIGVDSKGATVRFKIPIAVGKERGKYYWIGQNYGSLGTVMTKKVIVDEFSKNVTGDMMTFMISTDIDEYFKNRDGGHKEIFESEMVKEQMDIAKDYLKSKSIDYRGVITAPETKVEIDFFGLTPLTKVEADSVKLISY